MRETQHIQQIVVYIKKNHSKGYSMDTLKWALINQGYSRVEITKAIELAAKELADAVPKFEEKPLIRQQIEPVMEEPKKGFWKRLFG